MKMGKEILKTEFSFLARVLVATGLPTENGQKTEIIDLINPDVTNKILGDISERFGSVCENLRGQFLICGGYAHKVK